MLDAGWPPWEEVGGESEVGVRWEVGGGREPLFKDGTSLDAGRKKDFFQRRGIIPSVPARFTEVQLMFMPPGEEKNSKGKAALTEIEERHL